jgi:hypothetical protein
MDALERILNFFHRDGVLLANFDAALAAQAFVFVHGLGFSVHQFVYINGTNIYAFAIANALVFIDSNFKHFILHGSRKVVTLTACPCEHEWGQGNPGPRLHFQALSL